MIFGWPLAASINAVLPALRLQFQLERHLLFTEGGMFLYRTDYPDLDSNDLKVYFAYVGYRYTY